MCIGCLSNYYCCNICPFHIVIFSSNYHECVIMLFFFLICSFLWIFYFFNSLLEMTRSRSTNMRNSITKKSQDITRLRTIQSSSPSPIGSTHTQTSTPVPLPVAPNTSLPQTPRAATIAVLSTSLHLGLQVVATGSQCTDSLTTPSTSNLQSTAPSPVHSVPTSKSMTSKNRLRVYLHNNL